MDAQSDYETEPTIAVFDRPEAAHTAVEQLRARRFDIAAIEEQPLASGRYQAEDSSPWEVGAGMLRGALWGAPVGLLLGVGQIALLWTRIDHVALPWIGTALLLEVLAGGLVGGAVLGAYIGAMQRTRFDDDEAEWVDVPADGARELVAVFTSGPAPRIREVLRGAGARAFLDPTCPSMERALRLARPV